MFVFLIIVLCVYACTVIASLAAILTEISEVGHAATIQRWNDSDLYGRIQMPFTYFGLAAVVVLSALAVPIEMLFRPVRPVK